MKISISIIIPVYNVKEYIRNCLISVINQTYNGEIECILVNDCTPDESIDIAQNTIKDYHGNIKFKIIHHKKNKGLSAARNSGLEQAQGEYVYFLDSDDEITPNCIEELTRPLQNKKYDFIIGNYKTTGKICYKTPKLLLNTGELSNNKDIIHAYYYYQWYMMAWNKLCNTNFLKGYNLLFKEGLIHEDDLWSFQLACSAQCIYIVNKVTYIYKLRENSIITSNKLDFHIQSLISIIQNMVNYTNSNSSIENIAYNIIYNYKLATLNRSISSFPKFQHVYNAIRKINNTDYKCIFYNSKDNTHHRIVCFHNHLPRLLGCIYIYGYLRLAMFHPIKRLHNIKNNGKTNN